MIHPSSAPRGNVGASALKPSALKPSALEIVFGINHHHSMSDPPELGIFMDSVRDRVGIVPDSKEKTDALNGIVERYTMWWNQKQSLIDSLPGKALGSASSRDLISIGDLAESLHSDVDRRIKSVLDHHKSEMQERAKTLAAEVKARSSQKDHGQDRER